MAKASITTGIGDKGTTRLFSGGEVDKDDPRPEAYGALDELVSVLGVAASRSEHEPVRKALRRIQRDLFVVGAELATEAEALPTLRHRVDEGMLAALEEELDALEAELPALPGFVLPGGTPAAAHIDQARAVARRLERRVVTLRKRGLMRNESLLVWLNRLSDYLWLLARRDEGDRVILKDDPARGA
jgi:cob(I)alamin adenosyltransferase